MLRGMNEEQAPAAMAGPSELGGEESLVASARVWMSEALTAWAEDETTKVAVLAPLGVEHLGKAVLWSRNPVLLAPLATNAERSLLELATAPNLKSPKLRTIGLDRVLHRLESVLGALPIDRARRARMIDVRNGAMHVGSARESRHVLLDALAMCNVLLDVLGESKEHFFGGTTMRVP